MSTTHRLTPLDGLVVMFFPHSAMTKSWQALDENPTQNVGMQLVWDVNNSYLEANVYVYEKLRSFIELVRDPQFGSQHRGEFRRAVVTNKALRNAQSTAVQYDLVDWSEVFGKPFISTQLELGVDIVRGDYSYRTTGSGDSETTYHSMQLHLTESGVKKVSGEGYDGAAYEWPENMLGEQDALPTDAGVIANLYNIDRKGADRYRKMAEQSMKIQFQPALAIQSIETISEGDSFQAIQKLMEFAMISHGRETTVRYDIATGVWKAMPGDVVDSDQLDADGLAPRQAPSGEDFLPVALIPLNVENKPGFCCDSTSTISYLEKREIMYGIDDDVDFMYPRTLGNRMTKTEWSQLVRAVNGVIGDQVTDALLKEYPGAVEAAETRLKRARGLLSVLPVLLGGFFWLFNYGIPSWTDVEQWSLLGVFFVVGACLCCCFCCGASELTPSWFAVNSQWWALAGDQVLNESQNGVLSVKKLKLAVAVARSLPASYAGVVLLDTSRTVFDDAATQAGPSKSPRVPEPPSGSTSGKPDVKDPPSKWDFTSPNKEEDDDFAAKYSYQIDF